MGGVLQYKWEVYCSLSSRIRSQEGTAIQMGGVLPYKLEVYCSTFSETSRGWGFWNSSEFWCFCTISFSMADAPAKKLHFHYSSIDFRMAAECKYRPKAFWIYFLTMPPSGESIWPLTPILLKSIAIHLPFLLRYFLHHFYCDTFARSIAIHHQFVSRYASHLYRDTFPEVLGSGVVGTPPTLILKKFPIFRAQHEGSTRWSGIWSGEENPPEENPTQNKKVHLNKFFWTIKIFWTISVGFLTCVTGKKAKVRANFSKKFV